MVPSSRRALARGSSLNPRTRPRGGPPRAAPFSESVSGFGAGGQRRDYAQLLEQAKHVVACPGLDHLAIVETGDIHSGHDRVPVCWRDAHQQAFVGARCGPPGNDLVALGDLVVDRDAYVRERAPIDLNELLQAFRPGEFAIWHVGVAVSRVGSGQLVDHRELALIPNFLKRATRKGLVLLGHCRLLPFGFACRHTMPGVPVCPLPKGLKGPGSVGASMIAENGCGRVPISSESPGRTPFKSGTLLA